MSTSTAAATPADASEAAPLLELRGLQKTFRVRRGLRTTEVRALADVSFQLDRGEIVALVGESGSGKSTVARVVARLLTPTAGAMLIDGANVLAGRQAASLRYRRRVQMIFQDPYASLNPAHTVGHHLERPLLRHDRVPGQSRRERLGWAARREEEAAALAAKVEQLLSDVGLTPAAQIAARRPHELSGGQRQRVAIARALAVDPDLLIADEPTSMLDVSLRVDVLNLMARLKEQRRLALLFITHDLASARYLADRILVMYAGMVVEEAPAEVLVSRPAHPYTRMLLSAVPDPERPRDEQPLPPSATVAALRGGGGAASVSATGCPFAGRCAWVTGICRTTLPDPVVLDSNEGAPGRHRVRCHRADELVGLPLRRTEVTS
jgi:peptide/nickel transport system ATP-binding protein